MSAVQTLLARAALSEAGAAETAVAVTGSCAVREDAVLHREGDAWVLRGIAVGGLFRLTLEVDDAAVLDGLCLEGGLRRSLPSAAHPRRAAGVGPDHDAVLRLMRETISPGPEAWGRDARSSEPAYCEIQLRAVADVAPDDAVLVAAYASALLGRSHDSPLMRRVRHERPLAYTVRDTVLDCDGTVELRLRIGGDPTTCEERLAAALSTATTRRSPGTHAELLHIVQARLGTEARGGGERGAAALDLADRLHRVLTARATDRGATSLARAWSDLEWVVEHQHAQVVS